MAEKKNPLSNKQIQAAYRERHLKDEGGTSARLDVLLDSSAKLALQRMTAHYRVSQRAMLEKLITDAQTALLDTMNGDAQSAYYDSFKAK